VTDFSPDAFSRLIEDRTRHALAKGVLQPVETRLVPMVDQGLPLLLVALAGVDHKHRDLDRQKKARARGEAVNPFLPHDPDQVVAPINATHRCLFNRFPSLENQLLLVTRRAEHQHHGLTEADIDALRIGLGAVDGLVYYNRGPHSGASQDHKHLHLIPFGTLRVPFEPLMDEAGTDIDRWLTVPRFTFAHAFRRLRPAWWRDAAGNHYLSDLHAESLERVGRDRAASYALLITRSWYLLAPRRALAFQGLQYNSVAFVGVFFVRDAAHRQKLFGIGPMNLLRELGYPVSESSLSRGEI